MQRNWGSYSAGENAEWRSHFGKCSGSFSTSQTVTIGLGNSTCRYLPKKHETIRSLKNMHMDVNEQFLVAAEGWKRCRYTSMRLYIPPVAQDAAMKGARL